MTKDASIPPSPGPGEGHRSWLDVSLGLAFALGGAGFFQAAQGFAPMIPNSVVGPGLLPSICAVVFMIFGALLAVNGFRANRIASDFNDREPDSIMFIVVMIGGLIGVVFLMPLLGFAITAAVFGFVVTWVCRARWWGALTNAVVISGAVYYLFSSVLRVPLPTGTLF
jgi:putative tricarboxylic transport membrane protein